MVLRRAQRRRLIWPEVWLQPVATIREKEKSVISEEVEDLMTARLCKLASQGNDTMRRGSLGGGCRNERARDWRTAVASWRHGVSTGAAHRQNQIYVHATGFIVSKLAPASGNGARGEVVLN